MPDNQTIPRNEIAVRPARPEDTAQVLELTRTIWDGEDYVPQVWEEWLADAKGSLVVAEYQGRVVGLGKITEVTPVDWYMRGLRVDPQFQGRGIAAVLHEELLAWWERNGSGTLRLATHVERYPVHHLCERTGFTRLGEYYYYRAPALQEPPLDLRQVDIEQAADTLAVAEGNPICDLTGGIMDLPWVQSAPALETIEPALRLGHGFWWRERGGLMLLGLDNDDQVGPMAYIQYLVCPRDELVECLLDARRVASNLERNYIGWMTLHNSEMESVLQAVGFERAWDGSIYIYEKGARAKLPVRGGL